MSVIQIPISPSLSAREEITRVAKSKAWNIQAVDNVMLLRMGGTSKRKVLVEFHRTHGHVVSATAWHPGAFNRGVTPAEVTSPKRANVIAFIRGEK